MILFAPPAFRLIDSGFPADVIADLTRSRRAADAYRGYMEKQIQRWRGSRGQKNVTRPELEAAHGYDTKYAAHTLRLGVQGIEYLTTGVLTLPMPEPVAGRIRDVRAGRVGEQEALDWVDRLQEDLDQAAAGSPLPDRPDQAATARFLADFYAARYGLSQPEG
jgi:hypothetical protein